MKENSKANGLIFMLVYGAVCGFVIGKAYAEKQRTESEARYENARRLYALEKRVRELSGEADPDRYEPEPIPVRIVTIHSAE